MCPGRSKGERESQEMMQPAACQEQPRRSGKLDLNLLKAKSLASGCPCPWKVLILRNTLRHEGCSSGKEKETAANLPPLINRSTAQPSSSPRPAWLGPRLAPPFTPPPGMFSKCSMEQNASRDDQEPPNDKPLIALTAWVQLVCFLHKHLGLDSQRHSFSSVRD